MWTVQALIIAAQLFVIFCAESESSSPSSNITINEVKQGDFEHFFGENTTDSEPDCFGLAKTILRFFKPDNRHDISTRFFLSTRDAKDRSEIHVRPRVNLGPIFNATKKIVIICHGYKSTADNSWVRNMEKALLYKEDVNVIAVDWRRGADKWNYIQAASNTKVVGAELSSLVEYMITKVNISAKNFHLIGHSLGAHVVSYVSSHITGKVKRITGLDPANPCFSPKELGLKLDKGDADFVDVIHTNGRYTRFGLGLQFPLGHVDYYPNGGTEQPGCRIPHYSSLWKKMRAIGLDVAEKVWNRVKAPICSHSKAAKYFTEAIYGRCIFWGHKWDIYSPRAPTNLTCDEENCARMGMESDKYKGKGHTFYVFIRDKEPFCVREPENDVRMGYPTLITASDHSPFADRNSANEMLLDSDVFFFGVIILIYNVFDSPLPFVAATLFFIVMDVMRWHNWKIGSFASNSRQSSLEHSEPVNNK
ncbi:pancreatic lipase-related protein 2-like [Neocloeon triangulifer]|uniref:pancreatic lipase-related protein 2-like n=1 Tax=Neocloeon triangulifer TaxID=2078957 RepID=UPI00286EEA25|nr:pancreatic lipase-related protein 2-like [Neocloeon triangulifer]